MNEGDNLADDRLPYRLLTGPDNHEFCVRISEALADGYQLYGSPAITWNPIDSTAIVAQAIILAN